MAIFNIELDIDNSYKIVLEQYLTTLCIFLFHMSLEPSNEFNAFTMLLYSILGIMFYNLVVKQIILFL